ncbi:Hpt domain-containing protein [Endozoicomonas sp. 8E]|uniref:hybrid sensor histidine kinase/response regulator n=1 Tax=Endozoicomonas sp. 8E TaxID=3035692 RepID=UPI00293903EA|nr:Hpt domain-containing protein [Endozoicomonas sp. 8E]WOG28404.1 Hpt domain-containing protein [Endozoicomonas sp. 8E]
MAEQQDYAGLDWVKEEIEQTLVEARQALENYQQEPSNPAHIHAGQSAFSQVHGTLKMLQHVGATHLSQEMNKVFEALFSERVPDVRMALEVLMQATLQLTGYIQQTLNSGVDRPLALLPLINELRHLRGEDPLPEATFFFPDTRSLIDPIEPTQLESLEKSGLTPLLRRIRQKYQLTLAGYLRDQNRPQQIKILAKLFAKLQDLSWGTPLSPLWEASIALTEGLDNESIQQNIHVANLLRELDGQIRLFIRQGAPFINTHPNDALFRGLLYNIATSEGRGGFTGVLKSRYNLKEELERAQAGISDVLTGVNATKPVVEALNYELTGIKEALDLYLLSTDPDPLVLENQLPIIQQVADTLTILGMEDLKNRLKQKKALIQSVINTGQNVEEHLMDVAGTILDLEAALSRYAAGESLEAREGAPLLEEVYQAVVKEARHYLEQSKDAIVDFVDSHHHPDFLSPIPELLHKVQGGLSMTPLTRAADLVRACSEHIRKEWIENGKTPEKMELEHLADALTSIEYYLERLSDRNQEEHDAILDVAESSLSALRLADLELLESPYKQPEGFSQEAKGPSQEAEGSDTQAESSLELLIDEQSFLDGSVPVTLDENKAQEPTAEEKQPSEETADLEFQASLTLTNRNRPVEVSPYDVVQFQFTSSSSVEAEAQCEASRLAGPEQGQVPAPVVEVKEDPVEQESIIDDELLTVFIEEAGEVQKQLTEGVATWINHEDDLNTLKDVRRAFHTLKGSGRMVGASVVGELAWSIENMLNRLIEGTVHNSPELSNLVSRVTHMLPGLISDFAEQSQVLTHEVLVCMEQADALSRGESYTIEDEEDSIDDALANDSDIDFERAEEPVPLAAEMAIVEALSRPASGPETDIDVETDIPESAGQEAYDVQLLNVFLGESRAHLEVVQSFVEQVKVQGGKRQISDQVQRSLHTMKGIALMAEIAPLARIIVALEKNIKDFRAHLIPANDRVISMLEKGLELIQDGLEQLALSPRQPVLDSENYLSWLEALHAQLITEQHKAQSTSRKYTGGQDTQLFAHSDLGLLLDADEYLSTWRIALSRDELLLFQRELTTLAERATEARLTSLTELCDVLLDVMNYLDKHEDNLPGVLAAPLSNGFEAMVDMMNMIAAQQTPVPPQSVFTELRESLEALLIAEPAQAGAVPENIEIDEMVQEASSPEPVVENPEVEEIIPESLTEEPAILEQSAVKPEAEVAIVVEDAEELLLKPSVSGMASTLNIETEVEEHDLELLELFLEEATDLAEDCHHALDDWLNNSQNLTSLTDLQRSLHTLKGSARMADQPELGDLSHAIEAIYSAIAMGRSSADKAPIHLLQAAHDQVDQMLLALKNQQSPDSVIPMVEQLEQWALNHDYEAELASLATAEAPVEALPDYLGQVKKESDTTCEQPEEKVTDDALVIDEENRNTGVTRVSESEASTSCAPETIAEETAPATTRIDTPVTSSAANTLSKGVEMIRVPAQLVESLINLSGESSIHRGRIEQQIQDIGNILEEMNSTIDRVKEQLRRLDTETQAQIISTFEEEFSSNPEFDPLEMDQYSELTQLSRSLVESATDLQDLKEGIQEKNRDAETLLLQQSRTLIELQEKLMQARMVSFSRLLPRLRKITRQLSTELDKPINLNVSNAEGEMDRTMLERILAPLEHLLRNAIDHGIEPSVKDRLTLGKPETGNLTLAIARDGADIVIELGDDGRGINLRAVHAKALEKHLITPEDELSDLEIAQLILEPGFSTAESVTQISGRGVGLDVVNTEIRQMGGSIQIDSEPGKGTSFKLRLPFTLSVNRALMVQVTDNLYALPMQSIDGITVVDPKVLIDCYQNNTPLHYGGIEHQLMFLGEILGDATPRIQSEQCPVVIIERGGKNLALHVDEIIGGTEIFAKSLGPQFAGLVGVNGATILGDGRVAIIIDPVTLLRRHRIEQHSVELASHVDEEAETIQRVLVVDDSVTVRKVTTRLLERNGYLVESARDGVEALAKLTENRYDIMLLDIEMPKMDGYEVASAVRNDGSLKSLPIIMITSRTGEKHKARAFSLGVNEYLGKPFQEHEMLASIKQLISAKAHNNE